MFGTAASAASKFLLIMIVAKTKDSAAVGHLALALAVTEPIFSFASLDLRAALVTDTSRRFSLATYATARLVTTSAAVLLVATSPFLFSSLEKIIGVLYAVGATRAVEAMADLVHGSLQRRERLDLTGRSIGLSSILTLVPYVVVLESGASLEHALAARATAQFLWIVFHDVPLMRNLVGSEWSSCSSPPLTTSQALKQLSIFALPLGASTLVSSSSANVHAIIVNHHLGAEQLGIFSGLFYVERTGRIIISALCQNILPTLARHRESRNIRAFWRLLVPCLLVALVVGLTLATIALVAGESVLRTLYSAAFAQHRDVFVTLMVGAAITYAGMLLSTALLAARAFRLNLFLVVFNGASKVILLILLTPSYGLSGAAWALVAASTIEVALRSLCLGFALRHPPNPAS